MVGGAHPTKNDDITRIDRPEYYYKASLERIRQAWQLYREEASYALAMYVAGVSVECMLRAFKMRKDPSHDEKHDLRRLFRASGMLQVEPEVLISRGLSQDEANAYFREIQAALNEIHSLWANDYRYVSEDRLRAHLKYSKLDRGLRGDFLKANARKPLNSAQTFADKGVIQWISSRK
jgi:hypothetical protein